MVKHKIVNEPGLEKCGDICISNDGYSKIYSKVNILRLWCCQAFCWFYIVFDAGQVWVLVYMIGSRLCPKLWFCMAPEQTHTGPNLKNF